MTKVLVTGEPRSGTTLVANLLNAQDKVTIYRDFLHIARLREKSGAASLTVELTDDQKAIALRLFNEVDNVRLGIDVDVKTEDLSTLLNFYLKRLEGIAAPGDLVVGHKTTRAPDTARELVSLIPDLKVIHVLRDPRGVIVSALACFRKENLFHLADEWRRSFRIAREMAESSDTASRAMILRYEDLLREPEKVFAALCNFLGLAQVGMPREMSDYGKAWESNSSFDDLKGGLDTTPIERWKTANPRTGRDVEILLADVMAEAGYELSGPITMFDKMRMKSRLALRRAALLSAGALKKVKSLPVLGGAVSFAGRALRRIKSLLHLSGARDIRSS